MSDDSKKAFELFGLSEISQIQDEIEKDLNTERTEIPAESDSFAELFLVPRETEVTEEMTETGFYRETIKSEPKKSWVKAAVILFFACTLGTGMLGFGIGTGIAFFTADTKEADRVREPADNTVSNSFTGTSYIFEEVTNEVATLSDMLELLAPTVVGITTYRNESLYPFNPVSHGSGIIFAEVEDRIFIATNLYVVRAGERWDVSINGSAPITALPVGFDYEEARFYDLAVAYIYKEQLIAAGIDTIAFATFGDSDEMRIGDVVLAIGNAMGEGTSVTQGIISAAERLLHLPDKYQPLTVLQTDAALNYGSSGGPLINTRGEIIGININQDASLLSNPSQAEGIGYSISSNIAAPILENIIAHYLTPAIGIEGRSLADDDENRAEIWGIPRLGVLVVRVIEDRPAYAAGIRAEDVITSFDGQPVFDMPQLQAAIRAKEIGDVVEIHILRGGSFALTVQVELGVLVRDTF